MSDAIVAACQARLTAALPDWHDATAAAHPTPEEKLPAFAVRVVYTDAQRLSMGDPRMLREGQIEIGLEVAKASEADLHSLGRAAAEAILAPPDDLGGLLWQITQGGFEASHSAAADKISGGEVLIPIQAIS